MNESYNSISVIHWCTAEIARVVQQDTITNTSREINAREEKQEVCKLSSSLSVIARNLCVSVRRLVFSLRVCFLRTAPLREHENVCGPLAFPQRDGDEARPDPLSA